VLTAVFTVRKYFNKLPTEPDLEGIFITDPDPGGQLSTDLKHWFTEKRFNNDCKVCDASFSPGQDGGGGERVPGDLYAAPGRTDPCGQEAGAASLTRCRRQGQEDRRQNQGSVVYPAVLCIRQCCGSGVGSGKNRSESGNPDSECK
jgi:hypothetical protein